MKRALLFVFSFLVWIGCQGNENEVPQHGPLSKIDEFNVFALFSTYEENNDAHFKVLIDCLRAIGTVEILEKPFPLTSTDKSNVFFLSLIGSETEKKGKIDVISSVEVKANRFTTACSIWQFDLVKTLNNSFYPVSENGCISFKKDSQPIKKEEFDSTYLIQQLVDSFAKEYRDSNPKNAKPIFHVFTR